MNVNLSHDKNLVFALLRIHESTESRVDTRILLGEFGFNMSLGAGEHAAGSSQNVEEGRGRMRNITRDLRVASAHSCWPSCEAYRLYAWLTMHNCSPRSCVSSALLSKQWAWHKADGKSFASTVLVASCKSQVANSAQCQTSTNSK